MRVYSFTEARQKLAEVLDLAKTEDVIIQRRGGDMYVLRFKESSKSPFDVPSMEPGKVTTKDIVEAVRYSRAQPWRDKQ
jgi:hypothetical protein